MESWKCLATFICVCFALAWLVRCRHCFLSRRKKEVDDAPDKKKEVDDAQEVQPSSCPELETKHRIFLSHSGAQKPFVEQLCENLDGQSQYAFFDQRDDSLPKGKKFALLILDAAKKCEVAVVVLSREYLTSKWPMLELAEFVRAMGSENKSLTLLPLFYQASVEDLSDKSIEEKWRPVWKKRFGSDSRVNLEKWAAAIRELRRVNGPRLEQYGSSEVKYRAAIAKIIFRLAPPDFPYHTSNVFGGGRICEILAGKFLPHDRICAQVVGLFGMGGLGKTTMSKSLCNHFNTEFLGRVCYIEIKNGESDLERQRMVMIKLLRLDKDFLLQNVSDISQGWSLLQSRMKAHPVFLVIDNVSHDEESKEEVRNYLNVKHNPDSKIMVISRSSNVVEDLLGEPRFCCMIPCLKREEAAKIFLQRAAPQVEYSAITAEEKRVVISCIKEELFSFPGRMQTDLNGEMPSSCQNKARHYHPMTLRALGVYLHERSKASNLLSWSDYLPEYRTLKGTREPYIRMFLALGLQFNTLDRMTQLMFLDLSLYASKAPMLSNSPMLSASPLEDLIAWLANAHGEATAVVRSKIFDFERFAMINIEREEIIVHDLYIQYSTWFLGEVNRKEELLGVWCISEQLDCPSSLPCDLQRSPSGRCWPKLKRIRLENILCDDFPRAKVYEWCNVVVLQLVGCDNLATLNLQGMTGLRHLELEDLWHLRTFTLIGEYGSGSTNSLSPLLQFVTIDGLPLVERLPSFSPFRSSLKFLKVGFCESLTQPPIVQHCASLEMMLLVWYPTQNALPNLVGLAALRTLIVICSGFLSHNGRALKLETLSSPVSFGALGLRNIPVEDLPNQKNLTRVEYVVLGGVDYPTSLTPLYNLASSSLQGLHVWRYYRTDNRLDGLDGLGSLITLERKGSAARLPPALCETRPDYASSTFAMTQGTPLAEGERPNSLVYLKSDSEDLINRNSL